MKRYSLRRSLKDELPLQSLSISKGRIPGWLEGTLIRNGPSWFTADDKQVLHWFDGLAMLHAFSFEKGEVLYTNRFLRSEAYQKVFKEGSIDYLGFATDPCRSIFKRLFTAFFPEKASLHNANINIAKFCNQYVALTEIPLPVQFDPKTLETLNVFDYKDRLLKSNSWNSAHPHVDVNRKEIINYSVKFGIKSEYLIYRMHEDSSSREIIARIPVSRPSYMHSFAVTENYVILSEFPFVVNPLALLLSGKGFIQNYRWEPERGTCFRVVKRDTGELICSSKGISCFAFHHVNAFEKDHYLYLDLITYQNSDVIMALAPYGEGVSENDLPKSQLIRFEIDLESCSIRQSIISSLPFELPRIHPSFNGRPYRFAYAADLREVLISGDPLCLYKIDVQTGKTLSWGEHGCYPGEPIFVPNPQGTSEDEGLILSIVINESLGHSFLLILDATSWEVMARVEIPHQIPMGLHGQFYP